MLLNCDMIEHIDMTPDTVITLTNNQKFTVMESADEILRRVKNYRRSLLRPATSREPDTPAGSRHRRDARGHT